MSKLRNQGPPIGKPRKSSKMRRGKHRHYHGRRRRHHGQINFNSDASAFGDIKHFTSTSGAGIYQIPTHQSSSGSTNDGKDFEFCSTLDSIVFFPISFSVAA